MKRGILLICMLAASAWATTLLALDVNGLSKSSDVVVRGRVVSVSPRWTKDHARIVTDTELEVSESWKGAPSKRIVVMQPGGEIGEVGQHVEGIAAFKAGEEVVLFLEARGERFTVAGMAQGRFIVERSADGASMIARQDQCNELYLVDPSSRQAVSRTPISLEVGALKKLVVVNDGPSTPPTLRTTP